MISVSMLVSFLLWYKVKVGEMERSVVTFKEPRGSEWEQVTTALQHHPEICGGRKEKLGSGEKKPRAVGHVMSQAGESWPCGPRP